MLKYILTLLVIGFAVVCQGQFTNLKFDHITSEDGLPQSTIHGIAKDKYGFMWFGTWSGLCRYDGYRFRIYHYEQGNPRSISNNRIHNIIKDEFDDIWVLPFDETIACRYNYASDDFDRVPIDSLSPEFQKRISRRDHYLTVSFSYDQVKWSLDSNSNGMVETCLRTGQQQQYTSSAISRWALNDAYVSDIYLDDQLILWVGTYSHGINKANLEANPFNYFYHDPTDPNSIVDNNVRAICQDKNGNLWIGTRDRGITVIDSTGKAHHITHQPSDSNSIKSDQIKKLFCDSRGYVWIGTKKGLDRYNPETGRIRRFDTLGLHYSPVYGMMEDTESNIWFATWNGIYKYVVATDRMIHFDPAETLGQPHAWCILQDSEGRIWVGTEGNGIVVFREDQSGSLTIVNRFNHQHTSPNTISDNRVYCIHEDLNHDFWIGTGNGLDRYDPTNATFERFHTSPPGLAQGTIAGILEDDHGYIWVSHKRGISQINRKTRWIRNYTQQDGLQSNEFSDGASYKSPYTSTLFFGGNNGYNAFNPDSIKTNRIAPQVVLTQLQVLNKPVEINQEVNGRKLLDKPLYLTDSIQLSHRDKSVAIEFAALHFANPIGNKYAYMLEGFDQDWIAADAMHRVATYSNLSPGTYVFKVKAANSDGIWNPVPRELHISVAPAFWASTWAYWMYGAIFMALLYAFYHYIIRYERLNSQLKYETLVHEKERELNERKFQFFTNISHEIKTPLTLILAPIQRLMQVSEGHTAIQQQLRTMRDSGDRLQKLIHQLLDIRRLETGNEQLVLEHTDMVSLVKVAVDSFRSMAQLRRIRLETILEEAHFMNSIDPDKIEKVLYNLLSNAFKFTDDGGQITVSLKQSLAGGRTFAVICVEDNGIGIAAADIVRIFQPFQQSGSGKAGGTGLGLAYCKLLVELHGGTIHAESKRKKDGQNQTSFLVKIPVCATVHATANPAGSTTMLNTPVRPFRQASISLPNYRAPNATVLLVEDNVEMRRYLTDYFAAEYRVIEAANGQEGLEAAIQDIPDLIISDVMMPDVDGISLCKQLKADIRTSHIPVILLTARSPIEYEIEGIETGADDYIVKPFNLTVLSLKVKNVLVSRARWKEKFAERILIPSAEFNPVSPDEKLLQRIMRIVEDRISDSTLSVDDIGNQVGLSRAQLYRKMKALTGSSMADTIRDIRLNHAQRLLREKKFNVSETAYMLGFTDSDYFRKCFKSKFGCSPSEYSKSVAAEVSG